MAAGRAAAHYFKGAALSAGGRRSAAIADSIEAADPDDAAALCRHLIAYATATRDLVQDLIAA